MSGYAGLMSRDAKRIATNAISLGTASVASRALAFVYIAILSRQAGVEGVGVYSLATTVGGYFLLLADFGLSNYVIQSTSANWENSESGFNSATRLKRYLFVLCLPVIVVVSFLIAHDPSHTLLIILIALGSAIGSFSRLNYAVLRSRERMRIESLLTLGRSVIFVASAYWVLQHFESMYWIGLAYLVSVSLELALSGWIRRSLFFRVHIPSVTDWKLIRDSIPFVITSLVSTAFTQIDIVIIAFISTVSVIGEYTAVSRLLLVTTLVPSVIGSATWPATARLYLSNQIRFRHITTWSVGLNLGIAGVAVLGFWGMSEQIMGSLYGQEFQYLSPLLKVGSIFVFFKFLNLTVGTALTSAGRQIDRARAVFVGLLVTIALVFVLVPEMGTAGAVWALVLSEIALTMMVLYYARDLIVWSYMAGFVAGGTLIAGLSILSVVVVLERFAGLNHSVIGVVPSLLYVLIGLPVCLLSYFYSRRRNT